MRVSELSERTGVSIHRLRRWESAGLVRARRDGHGVRHFDDTVVRVVTFVARLHRRAAEIDRQIADLTAQRARVVDHVAWFEARRPTPTEETT